MADELKIEYRRGKGKQPGTATVKLGDKTLYANRLDVFDEAARQAFAAAVVAKCPGVDPEAIAGELLQLAGEASDDKGGSNQATILCDLAKDADLFHAPGADGDTYATIEVNGHRQTHRIGSKAFRHWLTGRYWRLLSSAPGSQAVQDALGVLAGRALHEGAERPVYVRLAEHEGCIYLDLADPEWRCVEISAAGWRVLTDPPVRFIRPRGVLALPEPQRGGRLDELRAFVNVATDEDWILLVAWMMAALRPSGPYPLLELNGEQGSAKTTTGKLLRALGDPNNCALRCEPHDVRDLMIAAANGHILAFDNLSYIPPWLSDALCRLSTGGGFSTRELYSDGEEKMIEAQRPVILTGIGEVATRPDLLDRTVSLKLEPIPEDRRRSEAELWAAFNAARPRILGALLDALSSALANVGTVRLPRLPRMADFALWVTAAEPGLGWGAGTFLNAYAGNIEAGNSLAIEASPIGAAVVEFVTARGAWSGTATALLKELEAPVDEPTRRRQKWPTNGRGLRSQLDRIAPNLRRSGVNVNFDKSTGRARDRIIRLEQTATQPSEPSEPSEPPGEPAPPPPDVGGLDGLDDPPPDYSGEDEPGRNGDGVPGGWTRADWAMELTRKADRCEAVNPQQAAEYREQAARLR